MQKAKYPLPLAHDRCTHAVHNGRRARTRPRGRRTRSRPAAAPVPEALPSRGAARRSLRGCPPPSGAQGKRLPAAGTPIPAGQGALRRPPAGLTGRARGRGPGPARGAEAQLSPRRAPRAQGRELGGRWAHGRDGLGGPAGLPLPASPAALTFFRGCHFIIFVQPTRGASRCGLEAGGRRRAAATASHAASFHPLVLSRVHSEGEEPGRGRTVFVFGSVRSAAATTRSHGARESRRPAAHSGRSGACSRTRACDRAPQPAAGALGSAADPSEPRPTARTATETRPGSCHPSPFWRILLFSKKD